MEANGIPLVPAWAGKLTQVLSGSASGAVNVRSRNPILHKAPPPPFRRKTRAQEREQVKHLNKPVPECANYGLLDSHVDASGTALAGHRDGHRHLSSGRDA